MDGGDVRDNKPLVKVTDRQYVETLECGHQISWSRPGPGTGGEDWPKLAERRRCMICGMGAPDEGESWGAFQRRING